MSWTAAVCLLGVAQIASWGSLYYALGVISRDIARDTGTSEVMLFAAFSGALLLAGALAPRVGRLIDSAGARLVMSGGSLMAALTFVLLALAESPFAVLTAWAVGGFAIAATLYDAGFAAVNQVTQEQYRRAVTVLTLFGGFASTVFWPLTHALQLHIGWRDTLWVYAAIHLLMCAPLHWCALRSARTLPGKASTGRDSTTPTSPPPPSSMTWLATSFSLGSAVVAVVGVHMVGLLTGTGLNTADAVLAAMLMGPAQVLGRIIEITLLGSTRATRIGLLALGAMAASLLILALAPAWLVVSWCFVMIYGLGNGVLTIVRGSAPAELYGSADLGQTLGRLSRPAMFAKALAPGLFAAVIASGIPQSAGLLALALLAFLAALALWKASTASRPGELPAT